MYCCVAISSVGLVTSYIVLYSYDVELIYRNSPPSEL